MLTFSDLLFSTDFIQFETPYEIPNFDNLYDFIFQGEKTKDYGELRRLPRSVMTNFLQTFVKICMSINPD